MTIKNTNAPKRASYMALHPQDAAPLSFHILIEARSFRKKDRSIIVESFKKNSSQHVLFGLLPTFLKRKRLLFVHHVLFTILREFRR